MCSGPGPYRAVLGCWAQPALHMVLSPLAVHALESITQKYDGQLGLGERCPVLWELSGGPHLGEGVLWDTAGGIP